MYYKLERKMPTNAAYIRKKGNKHEPLLSGALIDESTLQLPWPFLMEPTETSSPEMPEFYPHVKLMSKRLLATIQGVGVDNLQVFPAEITNNQRGDVIKDYVVVNVVGMVSCADEQSSQSTPVADVSFFHKLVIDPAKAGGLLLFRLADSVTDIIVAEKVAKAVEGGNFTDVVVEPLAEKANG